MIAVVLSMLRARAGQAAALLVLSTIAAAAAVSGPAYLAAADRAVIAAELAAAPRSELMIRIPSTLVAWDLTPPEADLGGLAELSGFTLVPALEFPVQGMTDQLGRPDRLVFREGFCAQVVLVAGRCPLSNLEVSIPEGLAQQSDLAGGDVVAINAARFSTDTRSWEPAGPPVPVVVVGVHRPVDPHRPYWGGGGYFAAGDAGPWAIFASRGTIQWLPHEATAVSVDAILTAEPTSREQLADLLGQVRSAEVARPDLGRATAGAAAHSDLPRLAHRVDASLDVARQLVPLAVLPLVALCWFVIYLTVRYGISGRRHEVALLALRGDRPVYRGALVAAEAVLPVLGGLPLGLVLGQVAVATTGWLTLTGPVPVSVTPARLGNAGIALAGSVAVVLLAQRRELAGSVAQLLRRVPPRAGRFSATLVEVLAVVLAAVAVVQLRGFGGELVGITVAAPALALVAVTVVGTRLATPLVDGWGRRALSRGRLGQSLAALQLARHPGGLRLLLALLALVFGTVSFAAIAQDVAAQARSAASEYTLGAARILTMEAVTPDRLLHAVRAADPSGRYAMAAVPLAGGTGPGRLAVDSPRLPVVSWPVEGAVGIDEVTAALRPPAPEPVWVTDGPLRAEFTAAEPLASVAMVLAPRAGEPEVTAAFGAIGPGRGGYPAEVAGCPDGCRLVGLSVLVADRDPRRVELTWHGAGRGGEELVPLAVLTDPARWGGPDQVPAGPVQVRTGTDGLRVEIAAGATAASYRVRVRDVPAPLPAVSPDGLVGGHFPATNVDGQPLEVTTALTVPAGVPWLSDQIQLVDLEYVVRQADRPGAVPAPQVWLAGDAPESIVEDLAAAGLLVAEERSVAGVRALLERSGAAVGLRFLVLAAALAGLLGLGAMWLVAVVDRRAWAPSLRDLRAQGLSRRTVRAATLWSYGGVVLVAAVIGTAAAAAAWLATGDQLPMVAGSGAAEALGRGAVGGGTVAGDAAAGSAAVSGPTWPRWQPVLVSGVAMLAALLAAALTAAWAVRRAAGTAAVWMTREVAR